MRITELNYQIFYWLNRMDSYDEVRSVAVFLFLSEEYQARLLNNLECYTYFAKPTWYDLHTEGMSLSTKASS